MGEPKQIYSIWTSNFNPRIIECILFPKIGEKRVKILKKKREHANAKNKSPKFFNTHWNGSAERKKKKKREWDSDKEEHVLTNTLSQMAKF